MRTFSRAADVIFAEAPTNEKSYKKLSGVIERLDQMSQQSDIVKEFPKSLKWFNTSEPLKMHKHFKNKIVVIDFWTYCCINCLHVIPEMTYLEEKFEEYPGIAFMGCHSAKFENEKDSAVVRKAVLKYDVMHPVINDEEMEVWSNLDISCWPSIMVISPKGYPLIVRTGEGNKDFLESFLEVAHDYYRDELNMDALPLEMESMKDYKRKEDALAGTGQ